MTAALLPWAILGLLQQDVPRLTASVDRDKVNVGEEVVLALAVSAAGTDPVRVEVPDFAGFVVVGRAERTSVSTGAVARRTTEVELTLRARTAGRHVLGPLVARQGDREVRLAGPEVEVTESGAAALLALNPRIRDILSRAPPPPRPGQVALSVLLSSDTVAVGEQVDVVTAAWLPRELRQQLRRQPVLQPPVLSGVWSYPQQAPPGIAATRVVGGVTYDVFIAHQVVFPLTPGRLGVPAASLRYSVPVAVQFFSQEERFTVQSNAAEIRVGALPPGAPPGFAGAVGRDLTLSRRVTPATARAGEAVTVELELRGEGNLSLWPTPALDWPAGARAYADGSSEETAFTAGRLGGVKRFRFVAVPGEAGALRVPAVRYPYYDPARGAYRLAELAAASVAVAPAGEAAIARASPPALLQPTGQPLASRLADGVPGWGWLLLLILPPLALLARGRLARRSAEAAAPPVPSEDAFDLLLAALGAGEASAEPERLVGVLRAAGLDAASAREIADLRAQALAHRFGGPGAPAPPPPDALAAASARLRSLLGGRAIRAGLALALLAAPPLAAQAAPAARTLYERGALRAAAERFAAEADSAPQDPARWYNLGAARYRLGEDGAAVAAWLRARRLAPRDVTIRRALALVPPPDPASARRRTVPPVTPGELALAGVVAWGAGWLVLWRRRRRRLGRLLVLGALAAGGAALALRWWYAQPLLVTARETPLAAAPHGRAPSLASLAPGATLAVLRTERGWTLVRADGERLGWVAPGAAVPVGR